MGRKSFGLVALVIVMGVVLLLVAHAWQKVAPETANLDEVGLTSDQLGGGERPKLKETQERTDAHADQLREALASSE